MTLRATCGLAVLYRGAKGDLYRDVAPARPEGRAVSHRYMTQRLTLAATLPPPLGGQPYNIMHHHFDRILTLALHHLEGSPHTLTLAL